MNALAGGLHPQQGVDAILEAPGSKALDTESVGSSGAGDLGINTGADVHGAVFIVLMDHNITS